MSVDFPLRKELLKGLPITRSGLRVRPLGRADLDLLAEWPNYPWPYAVFRFSFASCGEREKDMFFKQRTDLDDLISLVADLRSHLAIGYVSLMDIDWCAKQAGNIGIRVHPNWCDKGIGTGMLEIVRDWWLDQGMKRLRLDVVATNKRAIACYEKVGFRKTGEFWRDAPELGETDLDDPPRCAFLKGNVRSLAGATQVRFYWMEWEGKRP